MSQIFIADNTPNKQNLTINDYTNMKYMDRVLKESMRLYPPVPYISRQIKEPVDLGNDVTHPILANYSVYLLISIHRERCSSCRHTDPHIHLQSAP